MKKLREYELHEKIGTGGFGDVYRAYQPSLNRTVAIKVILPKQANRPEFIQRFGIEAQLVARLEHPYIVPLFDYWRDHNGAYLVMRYLTGGSLADDLTDNGPLELDEAADMLEQIANALYTAHRKQIVHQDLKPANILLDEDRNAYLTDFGIARDLQSKVNLAEDPDNVTHGSPTYISPEHIRRGDITAKSDIYSLGILMYELLTAHPPFQGEMKELLKQHLRTELPRLQVHRPDLPEGLNNVLRQATLKQPEQRYDTVVQLAQNFRAVVDQYNTGGVAPTRRVTESSVDLPDVYNPYKGLQAFREADAADFYGRDDLIKNILRQLMDKSKFGRFLAVMGASGSGKSSVVRAGVIPAIRRGDLVGAPPQYLATMIPGDNPMRKLEGAILQVSRTVNDEVLTQLRRDDFDLHDIIRQTLPAKGDMLLVIDQFEELFTLVDDEAMRQHVLDTLHRAVTAPDSRLRLIVTMRADFYHRSLEYSQWAQMFIDRQYTVLKMETDELRDAIEKPAQRAGLALEAGLVERILSDLEGRKGQLPLLQYTLKELYNKRKGILLTQEAYDDIGRVSGALQRSANDIYDNLTTNQQRITEQIFPRLVKLGDDSDDTRRRVLRSELMALSSQRSTIELVLDKFGSSGLLTFDADSDTREPLVEIAHEALINSWSRLKSWIDANRDALRIQEDLNQDAKEWEGSKRQDEYLVRGAPLSQYMTLLDNRTVTLTQLEEDFVKASAARQRRNRNLRNSAIAAIAILAVVAGIAAFFANTQRQEAEQAGATAIAESRVSRSRELAASSQNMLNTEPDLALMLSLQALAVDETYEARNSLVTALQRNPRLQTHLFAHEDIVRTVAVSPDASRMASGGRDNRVIIWDAATYEPLHTLTDHTDWIETVVFSPDGSQVVSTSRDNTAKLWDADSGDLLQTYEGNDRAVVAAAFSPDGDVLATGDGNGTLMLWETASGEVLREVEAHPESVIYAIAFAPEGVQLATGSDDNTAVLWDVDTLEPVETFAGHDDWVLDVAFSPDGNRLVTASTDASAIVWDVTGEQRPIQIAANDWVRSVQFIDDGAQLLLSDDAGVVYRRSTENWRLLDSFSNVGGVAVRDIGVLGEHLVLASNDTAMTVWSLRPILGLGEVLGQQSERVLNVAYAPDGSQVASAGGEGDDTTVHVWDVESGAETLLAGHTRTVTGLAYGGEYLASAGEDGRAFVWDGETRRGIIESDEPFFSLAYDGQRLALGSNTGAITVQDVSGAPETWTEQATLSDHNTRITALAFSPDGTRLASSSLNAENPTVLLWNLDTGEIVQRLAGHTDTVQSLAFSPDGTRLASGSRDRSVIVWDVLTGEAIAEPLRAHENWVLALAFSPDGNLLASGSNDSTLILWDARTLRQLGSPLQGHANWVTSVAFAADGTRLVSGSADTQVILWQTSLDEWRTLACEIAHRELSADEQRRYFDTMLPAAVCTQNETSTE